MFSEYIRMTKATRPGQKSAELFDREINQLWHSPHFRGKDLEDRHSLITNKFNRRCK